MKIVEQKTVPALLDGRPVKVGNTEVRPAYSASDQNLQIGWEYVLFGKVIAVYKPARLTGQLHDRLWITDAGWQTVTTKSRLNAILGYIEAGGILQQAGQWFFVPSYPEIMKIKWEGSLALIISRPTQELIVE